MNGIKSNFYLGGVEIYSTHLKNKFTKIGNSQANYL
nr:MAG TPA: hypothetical protein [Caudoviricetes sp.]